MIRVCSSLLTKSCDLWIIAWWISWWIAWSPLQNTFYFSCQWITVAINSFFESQWLKTFQSLGIKMYVLFAKIQRIYKKICSMNIKLYSIKLWAQIFFLYTLYLIVINNTCSAVSISQTKITSFRAKKAIYICIIPYSRVFVYVQRISFFHISLVFLSFS